MPDWFFLALIAIFVAFALFGFAMAGMASHLAKKIEVAEEELKKRGNG